MFLSRWSFSTLGAISFVISLMCPFHSTHLISEGETRWQLFNQCSHAMLQTYLGHINARGHPAKMCLNICLELLIIGRKIIIKLYAATKEKGKAALAMRRAHRFYTNEAFNLRTSYNRGVIIYATTGVRD
uniref:Secreted protein n=1 Tax=Heterorhabditis bacteriophora TaxID=37862 RepID=A0A1I7WR38_HETBA